MLQHRQPIRIVAHFVQQPQHEPRRDLAARHGDRAGDGGAKVVAGHPRDQVQARH